MPLPASLDLAYTREITIKGMASLFRLEAESEGQIIRLFSILLQPLNAT
jgi:hypothetical protein